MHAHVSMGMQYNQIVMIIVQLISGLGNQLFQYALYRSLQLKGKKVYLDDYTYYKLSGVPEDCTYQLDMWNLKYNSVSKNLILKIKFLIEKYLNKFGLKYTAFPKFKEKAVHTFDSTVFEIDNHYCEGWWQSEKYFKDIKNELKRDFEYKGKWSDKNREFRDLMRHTNSVCIHVRRGDYLKASDIYGNICTEDYYKKSIAYIKEKISNPHFFIFSNDIDWCKDFFKNEANATFVEGNEDYAVSYMDLVLMTYCKHHIIANSSFSWWGAWLSIEEGITISPKKWLNTKDTPDVWCDGWIKF